MEESIYRTHLAVEYIENNLRNDLTVSDIADCAGYSVFHFCRCFNKITHITPYNYLMRRRLTEAARALLDTRVNIIEIAVEFRFNSHEAFSRAFKKMFDLQPSQWRETGCEADSRLMPPITLQHLLYWQGRNTIKIAVIEMAGLHLTGLMTRIQQDPVEVEHLWDTLTNSFEGRKLAPRDKVYGVTLYPGDYAQDRFYLAAVEPERDSLCQPGFVEKHLPPGTYASILHQGDYLQRALTIYYLYHAWLPKSGSVRDGIQEIDCFSYPDLPSRDQNIQWEILIRLRSPDKPPRSF